MQPCSVAAPCRCGPPPPKKKNTHSPTPTHPGAAALLPCGLLPVARPAPCLLCVWLPPLTCLFCATPVHCVLPASLAQERSDFLTMNCIGGLADTVGVSTVKGAGFDISFAGERGTRSALIPPAWRPAGTRSHICQALVASTDAGSNCLLTPALECSISSHAGGSLSVDTAKNASVYGAGPPPLPRAHAAVCASCAF